jgi:hypothetical protein
MFVCIPAFLYIAPKAINITTCQPNKICSSPLVKSLSLDGIKSFHYRKHGSNRYFNQKHSAKVRIYSRGRKGSIVPLMHSIVV